MFFYKLEKLNKAVAINSVFNKGLNTRVQDGCQTRLLIAAMKIVITLTS